MSGDKSKKSAGKAGNMSQEQIIAGFQEMRNQQRAVASKISELEMDRKEHMLVVETLKEVDSDRKCFRMVGGVLVERTVREVLPALENNCEQLGKLISTLTQQLETKGKELNEYREKHNIKMRGEGEKEEGEKSQKAASSTGVLVAQDSTSIAKVD